MTDQDPRRLGDEDPREQHEREELLHTLHTQAQAIEDLAEIAETSYLFKASRDLSEAVSMLARGVRRKLLDCLPEPEPSAPIGLPRPLVPQNKELRTWAGFRTYYQNLETAVRADLHLGPDDEVTREMIYTAGGPPPRTTHRIMTRTFFLLPNFWPPSIWPEAQPAPQFQPEPSKATRIKRTVAQHQHQLGLGIAAMWSGYVTLETVLDGNDLDGTLHFCLEVLKAAVHAAPKHL